MLATDTGEHGKSSVRFSSEPVSSYIYINYTIIYIAYIIYIIYIIYGVWLYDVWLYGDYIWLYGVHIYIYYMCVCSVWLYGCTVFNQNNCIHNPYCSSFLINLSILFLHQCDIESRSTSPRRGCASSTNPPRRPSPMAWTRRQRRTSWSTILEEAAVARWGRGWRRHADGCNLIVYY